MTENSNERAMMLVSRIDDIFGGENIDDVRKALETMVAVFLLLEDDYEEVVLFFMRILQARATMKKLAGTPMTEVEREEIQRMIDRHLAGH